ncbi:PAS domain S-box protein [Sphingomicrobium lutaoense]|uniref:histidine kinase n=1 Tax=Sphingomicrobium lutaoense TaxID=515949 RepID=A0A839Z0K9_9SPHN|nr:PAS domain S-box protein [Sphingomicrobium lutaoense]MBB3763587.1 PAS domain S-box-containing protein [Sphingomicrobium lutaoense]
MTDSNTTAASLLAGANRPRGSFGDIDDGEFLRVLLDCAGEAFYAVDTGGVTMMCNTAFQVMLGFASEEEVLGRRLHDLIHHSHPDGSDYAVEECPIYKCARTGEDFHVTDEVFFRVDGSAFPVEYRASPILKDGKLHGAICTIIDVTERREVERRLSETSRRLDAILNNTEMAVFVMDEQQHCIYANASAEKMTGYRFSEMEGRPLHDVVHHSYPDGRPYPLEECPIDRAFPEENQMRGEEMFVHKDGSFYPVAFTASPLRGEGGKPVGTVIEARNIAEDKAREQELKRSEERYQLALNAASAIGTWDWDVQNDKVYADALFAQFYSVDPERAKAGAPIAEFVDGIHPGDRPMIEAKIDEALVSGELLEAEYRVLPADGALRWVFVRGRAIFDENGQPMRFPGVAVDVTDRKATEDALRGKETRLRLAVDAARLGEWELDVKADQAIRAPLHDQIFGYDEPVEDWGFHKFMEHVVPEDRDRVRAEFEKAQADASGWHFGCRIKRANDGEIRWVEARSEPQLDENGKPIRYFGLVQDVTEKKLAEQRLRELNDTLEQRVAERTEERDRIWRLSQDLLGVADEQGRWVSVNPAWTRVLGWKERDIVGQTSEAFGHPDEEPMRVEDLRRLADEENAAPFECRFRHKDGSYRWLSWTAALEGGNYYCVARDISAEKEHEAALSRAEEALRQTQKMDAVGQLTGGIAHDFNNLLTIITGNVDMAGRSLEQGNLSRVQRAIDNAQQGADRAAALTQRLLAFSRRQPLDPKPVDLGKLVEGMAELLHRALGERIELETLTKPDLWLVEVDPGQIESSILNLAVNSRDAMAEGGKLIIEATNARVAQSDQRSGLEPGEYVVLAISDDGEGMDKETTSRVFDPFFTTKEVGKGTGLGLSMVYGFVKQSGGHVKIHSTPGEGTTVRLYLPRMEGDAAAHFEDDGRDEPVEGAESESTILVVEDDDDVRIYTVEILRELGYRVLEAHDGASALSLLDRRETDVDLLFTDVVMPGMSGRELADKAREMQPDLKVLYTSGYTRDEIVHEGRIEPGVDIVSKPFTYQGLARRIREMLGSA